MLATCTFFYVELANVCVSQIVQTHSRALSADGWQYCIDAAAQYDVKQMAHVLINTIIAPNYNLEFPTHYDPQYSRIHASTEYIISFGTPNESQYSYV